MAKTVYTNQQVINQIDSGWHWTTGGSTASTITYGVTTNRTWFPSSYGEYSGWSALNAKQAAIANLATELWDDLIAPSMVAASNPNTADIRFSNSSTGVSYAHAYFPGETGTDTYDYQKAQGSVWFNPAYTSLTDPDLGEYGVMALVHEIGHALGLNHPGNYNGGSPTYANDALYEQDTHMYTVMSYFSADNTGADWYASNGWWQYAQTPMLHDVLSAQAMYGADMTTRTGDTVYGFNSNTGNAVFDFSQNANPVLTIWDAGGNDTLDLSGWNTNSVISLEPGTYSHGNSMTYNIAIAFGAMIENAVGGSGNDQITGNSLANNLRGLGGNDVIDGGAGDDWLDGGSGFDTLLGGAGNDTLIFDTADNLGAIDGGTGTDTLIINGGSVRALDLAAHNIEFAEHAVTDAGSAPWSEYTDYYDASWTLLSQDGNYDAGGRWYAEWDVAEAFSWGDRTFEYDALNRLYDQTGTYDTGRTWHAQWDVDGIETWARQVTYQGDPNAVTWSQQTQRFDDLNRLYEQTGTYDTGRTWQNQWDVDGTEVWSRQATYQDAPDTQWWTEFTLSYDDLNRRYGDSGIYDDGRTWQNQWDVDDTEVWSRQATYQDVPDMLWWSQKALQYDDLSRLYDETATYNDGRTLNTLWDVDSTETWSRQATLQDAASTQWWGQKVLQYDDLNRLYDETGTYDDGRSWHSQWDVAGAETWNKKTQIFDTADNYAWAELIYEYDASGTLLNFTSVDDIV